MAISRQPSKVPQPSSDFNDNVFINCPFDKTYKPIFDAIVFAIHDAGFVARCALEVVDSGQTRLDTIVRIIEGCRYGIHDISRTQTGAAKIPRFNMPFECGLFWGSMVYGRNKAPKRLLVLDSVPYRYQKSLSDIAGQDALIHDNDPETAVHKVRSWLNAQSGRDTIPGGRAIWNHYQLFRNDLPLLLKEVKITKTELDKPENFVDYTALAVRWLAAREISARQSKARQR